MPDCTESLFRDWHPALPEALSRPTAHSTQKFLRLTSLKAYMSILSFHFFLNAMK